MEHKNRCRHCSWLDMGGDGKWKCLYNWKNCYEVKGAECPINGDDDKEENDVSDLG